MKGVILAGGKGSRLKPLTTAVTKQLLPVYDKPLIYYPITTLILAGINELLIVTSPEARSLLEKLTGNGSQWGVTIDYEIQDEPRGLAHGLLLAQDFVSSEGFAFILGDNLFYGRGLGRALEKHLGMGGAQIFGVTSNSPESYGVAELDDNDVVVGLEEKPQAPKSNIVIPGLYFFDNTAFERAKTIQPSQRGELEIVDLLENYRRSGDLHFARLPLGTAWLDSGTFENLFDASSLVRSLQATSGQRIGDPRMAAESRGWI